MGCLGVLYEYNDLVEIHDGGRGGLSFDFFTFWYGQLGVMNY